MRKVDRDAKFALVATNFQGYKVRKNEIGEVRVKLKHKL